MLHENEGQWFPHKKSNDGNANASNATTNNGEDDDRTERKIADDSSDKR